MVDAGRDRFHRRGPQDERWKIRQEGVARDVRKCSIASRSILIFFTPLSPYAFDRGNWQDIHCWSKLCDDFFDDAFNFGREFFDQGALARVEVIDCAR